MNEPTRRLIQRLKAEGRLPSLKERHLLKIAGSDADLDLSLPHSWDVVYLGSGVGCDFGAVRKVLVKVCEGDMGLHPFVGGLARPLTFKEIVRARLDQWEKTGEFGNLWESWLDSCSGIAYKANSTKFKIIPIYGPLLRLGSTEREVLSVNYDSLPGFERDQKDDIYNQLLTQEQAKKNIKVG